ncbi:MAG: orotate phosphoribosyltransferase [Candidatus Berkiella sp.]
MENYQHNFIEFIIQENALRFGEFTLKSGRKSPYFFNIGHLYSGDALAKLGQYYALTLTHNRCQFDVLFGPAYKGIPLAVATAIQLTEQYQINIPYSFNRKEAKAHGEGGLVVGAALEHRKAWIIDDVITAGDAKKEAIHFIQNNGGTPAGIIIALDRQEKAQDSQFSAVQLLAQAHHIPVLSIVTLNDVITYLKTSPSHQSVVENLLAYQKQYGTN